MVIYLTKVIETNISYYEDNTTISDVQSRVIEVDSWNAYLEEIRNQEQVFRYAAMGNLSGVSFPRDAIIKDFDANNKRLICHLELYNGNKLLKIAYVCR